MTLGILGIAATTLGGLAYRQKLITQIENIDSLNATSEALLLANRQLESVVSSIKAAKQLQQIGNLGQKLIGNDNWQQTKIKTAATLQQAIYGTQEVNRLQSHGQKVNAVAYSADGELIATASDDLTIKVWTKEGKLLTTLTGHSDRVTSISFQPLLQKEATTEKSYLLVSGSADKTAILWEVNQSQGKQIQQLKGHTDWVTDVNVIKQENSIIITTASRDRTIKLWREDGTLINTLSGHQGWVNSIELYDSYLISGGADGKVTIWNINHNNSQPITNIQVSQDSITDLALNNRVTLEKKDNNLEIAVATDYGEVSLLDLNNNSSGEWQFTRQNITSTSNDIVNSITFSPDNKLIAVATDKGINIYSRDGILQQTLTGHNGEISGIDFQPLLLTSLQQEDKIERQKETNNNYTLASTGVDKTVRIWHIYQPTSLESGGIYNVAISPTNSDILATAGFDGQIRIWLQNPNHNSQQLIHTLSGHESTVKQIKYSPDGKILAAAGADRTIKIWDLEKEQLITTLQGHQAAVSTITFTFDNKFLISGSEDKTIKIWDIQADQEIVTLKGHTDSIKTIAVSPNDKYIVSAGYDKTIKIWNLQGKLLQSIDAHNLAITDLQFTPDGQTLVSASWDNTIKLWNVQTLEEIKPTPLHTLSGHQDGVTDLLISKDGKLLVSASADRTIKLWQTKDGSLIKILQGHVSQINSIAFSNNEQSIISADEQQGLYWWNLELDNLLAKGCSEIGNYLHYNNNIEKSDRDICH
jgi:WD40 repeat protein